MNNESLKEFLIFLLDSDLSIMYKKVVIKKMLKKYLNNENEEEIKNIINEKNKDIYDYLFVSISYYNKIKDDPEKVKKFNELQRKYYNEHKEKLCEKKREEYQKNREDKIFKVKKYNELKKKEKELLNDN